MSIPDKEKLFAHFNEMGVEQVRLKLAQGAFYTGKAKMARFFLETKDTHKDQEYARSIIRKEPWSVYEISKRSFGKKINFVTDSFKRKILFRDIEHAYHLAEEGFAKSAVILAGGVIEELLRLYLTHKNITPSTNTLHVYIETCERNGLLKVAIQKLADSVRHFRNLVHLVNETEPKHSISKATAMGAVSSTFTIANDFQ